MKVSLIVDVSGTRDGVDWPAQGVPFNVDADEAAHLISAGIAVKHAAAPVESADLPAPPENAATKPPAAKKAPARKASK